MIRIGDFYTNGAVCKSGGELNHAACEAELVVVTYDGFGGSCRSYSRCHVKRELRTSNEHGITIPIT